MVSTSVKTDAGSRIFAGFRALGLYSNHVPLAIRYHHKHKETYLVTCVGKTFHVYNCSKLGITRIGGSHPEEINCLTVNEGLVFTGCRNVVHAFSHGRQLLHEYNGHDEDVHLLLPFGRHLISVSDKSCLKIWDIHTEEEYLELNFDNASFQITCVMHPSTYLNKILLASKQGSMQLWNIKTSKLLYTFPGWNSPITVVEQAPAVDVVAVGLEDGQVILHNLRYDETLMKFSQDWGPVTAISFRKDGQPIMATGSTFGHIALWNLEDKKLLCQMRDAHAGSVTGLECLQSEPLMVTSSPDNSIKVWIFDQADGGGRVLRQRCGHHAPPSNISFHGTNGESLLSAGQDSTLRSFSTVHDRHNRSLGRASFNKKETKKSGLKKDQYMMPPITAMASEKSRESDWDGIVACHRGLAQVTTWNIQRSTMGQHVLLHERFQDHKLYAGVTAQCVTVTSCGNFCVIGYSSGHVDSFNMQSGLYRGSYGNPQAHVCSVEGVAVDGLNQVTVTTGQDKVVKLWKFKTKALIGELELAASISHIHLHRESTMLAIACDDFSIVVVDLDSRGVIRTFNGHSNQITGLSFSPDARWLLTSSMDSSVRTWHLPTGRLVDCFGVDAPVTSISMSPTGEFLATAHVDDLGIYLWSNLTLYKHTTLLPLPDDYQPAIMELPGMGKNMIGSLCGEEKAEDYDKSEFKSPAQISDELVTLSLLPNSRWQSLLNLEIIKQRNKPKLPPKVPKAAPFFIPTIPGLEPKFAAIQEDIQDDLKGSRVLTSSLQNLSEFGKLLQNTTETKNYGDVLEALKAMGPSAIDVELRSLDPETGGSMQLLAAFLTIINQTLLTNRDFELAQSYLALFLKLHGKAVASSEELVELVQEVSASSQSAWNNIENKMNLSLTLAKYLNTVGL